MDLTRCEQLIADLEADPERLPAFYTELESVIASCMDEVYELAKTGADDRILPERG